MPRIGHSEKLTGFQRLDAQVRKFKVSASGLPLEKIIEAEWAAAKRNKGMTVLGSANARTEKQLSLSGGE